MEYVLALIMYLLVTFGGIIGFGGLGVLALTLLLPDSMEPKKVNKIYDIYTKFAIIISFVFAHMAIMFNWLE